MAKKDKVKIEKLNIKIGGIEIHLSLDEVMELKDLLNETFGKTEFVHGQPIYIPYDRPVVVPYNPYPGRYWRYEIGWGDNDTYTSSGTAISTSNNKDYTANSLTLSLS